MNKNLSYKVNIQYLFLILVLMGLFACEPQREKQLRDNKLKKISMAFIGGFSRSDRTITIDSTLTCFYYQINYFPFDTTIISYGKVSQLFWDTVNYKVENIPSKEFDSNYILMCNDAPKIRMVLTYRSSKKQLEFYDCDKGPKDLEDLASWVWQYQKKMKLYPCFEINPKRLPPPPRQVISSLKVIPPK